jgi:hypothetical protein
MMIPFIRTLLVITLCTATALADDTSLAVGHWRFAVAGMSTGDFYFEKDGRFRWVISRPNNPKPVADSGGTYKLADGILELHYASRPDKPQKWRCTVDADNLTIGAMTDTEKMVYKRILDKK